MRSPPETTTSATSTSPKTGCKLGSIWSQQNYNRQQQSTTTPHSSPIDNNNNNNTLSHATPNNSGNYISPNGESLHATTTLLNNKSNILHNNNRSKHRVSSAQSQQSLSDGVHSPAGSGSHMLVGYPSSSRPLSATNRWSPACSSSASSSSAVSSGSFRTSKHRPYATTSHITETTTTDQTAAAATTTNDQQLPNEVPLGLVNLGNTCYMNSVLQALYSISPFRQLIEQSYTSKPLSSNLRDLFKSMKRRSNTAPITNTYSSYSYQRQIDSSSDAASPASFKQTFARYQSKFSGLNQQDAQEFLRYLINGCHDEMNQVRSSSSRRNNQPPRTASEAWSQYRDIVDNSPLVDMLVGQLCSTITCSMCQNQSHCWDPFWDLSLALSNHDRFSARSIGSASSSYYHKCRLADLIAHFTASETLDGDERPTCEKCTKPTRSSKQINFTRLPRVLILHLKKFSNDGYKLSSPEVQCEDVLELESGSRYYLAAAISHHGHSASSGHYTAHCKYSSHWFHFNDDR